MTEEAEPMMTIPVDPWEPLTQPLRDVMAEHERIVWFRTGEDKVFVSPRFEPQIKGPYVFFRSKADPQLMQALHVEAIHGFAYED
jgi:hypothetical protein